MSRYPLGMSAETASRTPVRVPSPIKPTTVQPRLIYGLAMKGYMVVSPAERRQNRVIDPRHSIHQRILTAFYMRMSLGRQQAPQDLTVQGLTDAEVSELLAHPDLHRRTAELRACGLLTQDLNGETATRTFRGKRGLVSIITPAGVAALRELGKESHHEGNHPA